MQDGNKGGRDTLIEEFKDKLYEGVREAIVVGTITLASLYLVQRLVRATYGVYKKAQHKKHAKELEWKD